MGYRIGIDVGGTFTDFVAVNTDQQMYSGKTPTITADEAASVFAGLEQIAAHFGISLQTLLAETDPIVLGTTVVTNTMLEFAGANIGLITTKGFRDIIELRRGYKESLFDIRLPPPHPIVERGKRLGVTERIDASGQIVTPLDEQEVYTALERLRGSGVEAIAVCLLFSFVNPIHERRVRDIIHEVAPDLFVTLSSDVLPQVREFEREHHGCERLYQPETAGLSGTAIRPARSPGLPGRTLPDAVQRRDDGYRLCARARCGGRLVRSFGRRSGGDVLRRTVRL